MAAPVESDQTRTAGAREALVHAYVELLRERGAATPREVAERADLNRSSFYAHFGSMEELATHAFRLELEPDHRRNLERQFAEGVPALRSNLEVIRDIVAMAARPTGPLLVMLRADREFGEQALGAILASYVDEYVGASAGGAVTDSTRRRLVAEYVGHALSAVLVSWILGELEADAQMVESVIAGLTPEWIIDPARPARSL